jgi:hypothetical protein
MKRSRSLLLLITCSCFCILLTACGSTSVQNQLAIAHITSTSTRSGRSATRQPTTASLPALPTNCPPAGTGRAATMTPLAQPVSNHQNIVYINEEGDPANRPTAGALIRYDVTSGKNTTILRLKNAIIQEAHLSTDGQWILFTDQIYDIAIQYYGPQQLQLVRIDGQGLQTLYCATSDTALLMFAWSPDQQRVAFSGGKKADGSFAGASILDLRSGKVQLALDEPPPMAMLFWKDNQRLYISFPAMVPTNTLYLLDTTRGPNQHKKDLTPVFQQQTNKPCWDADKNVDGSALFISQCTPAALPEPGSGAPYIGGAPASISQQAATGGPLHTILRTKNLAIIGVHAISKSVLLIDVSNPVARRKTDSRNGLWKVNTDGSGLLQLMHEEYWSDGNGQPAWTYASRDGTLYAYRSWDQAAKQNILKYGSLNGGPTTSFATSNNDSSIVGWSVL